MSQTKKEQLKQLVVEYRENGNRAAGDELIRQMDKLVWKLVHIYSPSTLNMHDKQDLFQVGCMGACKAIKSYDLSSDVSLLTYAYTKIMREITRGVHEVIHLVRVPYNQIANIQKFNQVTEDYVHLTDCKESHKQYVMRVMNIKEFQYNNLHQMATLSSVGSLDMHVSDEEGAATFCDLLSTDQVMMGYGVDLNLPTPEQHLIRSEQFGELEAVFEQLTHVEQATITQRLLDGRRKMTKDEKKILAPVQDKLRGLLG